MLQVFAVCSVTGPPFPASFGSLVSPLCHPHVPESFFSSGRSKNCDSGKYIATQRYEQWYGEGMTKDSVFQTNLVFTSDPRSSLAGAFPPALAPTVLVDNILFETAERPAETRLFHGTFRVPACRAGVYRVRVTSQDSHDMFVDQQHVIKTNGVKTGGVVVNEVALHFKPNTDHSMEVRARLTSNRVDQ